MALWLTQECRKRDEKTPDSDDYAVTQGMLASVLASETTLVDEYATLA